MPSMTFNKLINRLAVEVDPEKARRSELAKALEVSPRTVWLWLRDGRMTALRARDVNRKFGDALAPMKVLTGNKP